MKNLFIDINNVDFKKYKLNQLYDRYYDEWDNRRKPLLDLSANDIFENKREIMSMLLYNNWAGVMCLFQDAFLALPFDEKFTEKIYDKIDKELLIRTKKLPFDFIEKHIDDFEINDLLIYQQCSMEFLEKCINIDHYGYLMHISNDQILTEEFILKYKDKLIWSLLSAKQYLFEYDKKFLRKISKYIDWEIATFNCIIDTDKLLRINRNLAWDNIVKKYDLSAEFIEKYHKYMDINDLFYKHEISEDILSQHIKEIHSDEFSRKYPMTKLSKQFINDNKHLFEWEVIAKENKYLNLEFISDYLIDQDYYIERNRYIDDDIKKQISNLKNL